VGKKTGLYLPIHLWDLNMEEKERNQIIFIEVNNSLLCKNRFYEKTFVKISIFWELSS